MLSRLLCFRNLSRGFHKWRQWAERFTRSIYERHLRDARERLGNAENQLSILREERDSAVRRAESAEKHSDEEATARRKMQEQADEHTKKMLRKAREEMKVAMDEKRQISRKLRESEHERSILESRCEALQEKADMVDSLEEKIRAMQEDRSSRQKTACEEIKVAIEEKRQISRKLRESEYERSVLESRCKALQEEADMVDSLEEKIRAMQEDRFCQQETSDALTREKMQTAELREQLNRVHAANQLQIEILSWLLELHSEEPTEQSKVFLSEIVSVFKRSKERCLLSDMTMEIEEEFGDRYV